MSPAAVAHLQRQAESAGEGNAGQAKERFTCGVYFSSTSDDDAGATPRVGPQTQLGGPMPLPRDSKVRIEGRLTG